MAVKAGDVMILRAVLVVAGGGEGELGLIIDLGIEGSRTHPSPVLFGFWTGVMEAVVKAVEVVVVAVEEEVVMAEGGRREAVKYCRWTENVQRLAPPGGEIRSYSAYRYYFFVSFVCIVVYVYSSFRNPNPNPPPPLPANKQVSMDGFSLLRGTAM